MLALNDLNDAQRYAVTYGNRDALLVLAGPGSGKTHTLTKRILYLISNQGISPDKILVLTFTKAAALEMQNRFLKTALNLNLQTTVNFGTFHSIFYSILKESNRLSNVSLLSTKQKKNILVPILENVIDGSEKNIKSYCYNLSLEVLDVISYYKNTLNKPECEKRIPLELKSDFWSVYERYEQKKKERGLIDFDDMLMMCLEMMKKDKSMLGFWQKRFTHILIDEFQDINPVQYEIIKCIGKGNVIFAVGDDDQSIYGFRGANPNCMKQFVEDFQANQIVLHINYRSRESIVINSSKVIEENKNRFLKELASYLKNDSENIEPYPFIQKFVDYKSQNYNILEQIQSIPKQESVAILFRTNSQLQKMAAFFRQEKLCFQMKEKEKDIYDHFVVKDIFAYCRLFNNKNDYASLTEIINKPCRYISKEALLHNSSLEELEAYYKKKNCRDDRIRFLELMERQISMLSNKPLYLQMNFIRKMMGYDDYLKELSAKEKGDFEEWISMLCWMTEEASKYKNISEWEKAILEYKSTSSQQKDKGESKVFLMTVHASKGLEFDHVIIPECNERNFPYGNLQTEEQIEEERRIFYVAMTRAKKSLRLLYLTGTSDNPRQSSRFIHRLIHQTHSCPDTHQKLLQPFHIHHRHQ